MEGGEVFIQRETYLIERMRGDVRKLPETFPRKGKKKHKMVGRSLCVQCWDRCSQLVLITRKAWWGKLFSNEPIIPGQTWGHDMCKGPKLLLGQVHEVVCKNSHRTHLHDKCK